MPPQSRPGAKGRGYDSEDPPRRHRRPQPGRGATVLQRDAGAAGTRLGDGGGAGRQGRAPDHRPKRDRAAGAAVAGVAGGEVPGAQGRRAAPHLLPDAGRRRGAGGAKGEGRGAGGPAAAKGAGGDDLLPAPEGEPRRAGGAGDAGRVGTGNMLKRIDHVMVLVRDVGSAFETYTRRLGFPVSWQPKRHEGWENAAVGLGGAGPG